MGIENSLPNVESLGKTKEEVLNKRKVKVLAELKQYKPYKSRFSRDKANLLQVNEEEYKK